MTRPVVAGYDGTPESKDALALARLFAHALDAPVVVLSVLTAAPLEADWGFFLADLEELGERLGAEAREALSDVADVSAITVPDPSPPHELHRIAAERNAKVVVLGSTHRGRLGRVLPGTVADRLLTGGTSAVAVAPRGFAQRDARLESIAVGLDGSAESREAAAQACEIAAATGASVTFVCAFDPGDPVQAAAAALGYPRLEAPAEWTRERVDGLWSMARQVVRDLASDVGISIRVVEGDAASVLIERSDQVDLLVLGSRGYGPIGRVLTGTVSSAVLRKSHCPVLVTPRPDREPGSEESPGTASDERSMSTTHSAVD